jgi:glucose/arabinose dehydrogenase
MRLLDRSPGLDASVPALGLAIAFLVAACGATAGTPTSSSVGPGATSSQAASPTATPTPTPEPTPTPTPTPYQASYPLPAAKIAFAKVLGGFSRPVSVASMGDARLFVVEQTGRIKIVVDGAVKGTFLDISSRLSSGSERGLLGLAFHPDYAANGRLFVRYTDKTGDVRISEFRVTANPDVADPASEKPIITIRHRSHANHNGGAIAFGPDGYLYIGTGDGGGGGDPDGNGQKLNVLLGKMLRLDVDNSSEGHNYAVPDDNPFAGQEGKLPEIWAYGLRNPYMFSFDRATGDLWIADVGQSAWEEVDRATLADGLGAGANYGWNSMEGNHCYYPGTNCNTSAKVLPLAEYKHGSGESVGCSIIGAFVYRGAARPDLLGRYFFGDYCSGNVWDVAAAGPSPQTPHLQLRSGLNFTGFGEGSDGEIYAVTSKGVLYRLQ